MKITAVETFLHPKYPLILWVRLHTDAGLIGLGETIQSPDAVARVIVPTNGSFALPPGPGLGTDLRPEFLAQPELAREATALSEVTRSSYAVGNPYRVANPWRESEEGGQS